MTLLWTVAEYVDTGREYGGPEEGGWYYSTSERVFITTFHTKAAADGFAEMRRQTIAASPRLAGNYVSIRSWNPDLPMEDPTFPTCHDEGVPPEVPASVDVLFPPYQPVNRPHYC